MEHTSTSSPSLQTRAFALLRKWMKNGPLNETETHELIEIQREIPTASVQSELNSFKSVVNTQLVSIKESQDTRFDSMDKRFDSFKESQDTRFDSVDKRFDSVDKRFDSIDKRFDSFKESQDIRFAIILKWLKITSGIGISALLAMGGWLIRLLIIGAS